MDEIMKEPHISTADDTPWASEASREKSGHDPIRLNQIETELEAWRKEREARRHSAEILFELAKTYHQKHRENGDPGLLDLANQNYMKAADLGHSEAQYTVALHAEAGLCHAWDDALALAYLRMAAYYDHAEAQYRLAERLRLSDGMDAAREWYEAAARNGSLGACLFLGDQERGSHPDRAAAYYRLAAERDPSGIPALGEERCSVVFQSLYGEGKYGEALDWIDESRLPEVAERLLSEGESEQAISCYAKFFSGNRGSALPETVADQLLRAEAYGVLADWYREYGCYPSRVSAVFAVTEWLEAEGREEETADWYALCERQADFDREGCRQAADAYWSEGKPARAIPLYKKILDRESDEILARRVADFCFQNGDREEAVEWYKRSAVSAPPADREVLAFLAENPAANDDPALTSVWNRHLGDLLRAEGDSAEAARCYEKCRAEDLSDEAVLLVAEVCQSEERPDDAEAWYSVYYQRVPNADDARKMADRLWKQGRKAQAVVWYERYASERRSPNIAKLLGDYYYDLGDKAAAIPWYERLYTPSKSSDEQLIGRLAECCQDAGQTEAVAVWMQRMGDALKARGDADGAAEAYLQSGSAVVNPPKQKFVGDYCLGRGDAVRADEWYGRYFEQRKDLDFAKELANRLWKADQREIAVKWYERYAVGRRSANVARLIADYHFENGHLGEALPWYERLHSLSKKADGEVILRLADCCKAVGKTEEAASWMQSLGDVHWENDDMDGAIAAYAEGGEAVSDADKQMLVAEYFLEQDDLLRASDWYHRYFSQTGDLGVARMMAERCRERNESALAISWYECLEQEDCTPDVAKLVADHYFKETNYEKAVRWYEKLHEMKPIDNEILLKWILGYCKELADEQKTAYWSRVLGNFLLDKNDVDKAALTYIKYADAVTDPEKQKLVGHYYLKNNDFENADVWFERAFRQTKDLALAAEVADRFRAAEPSRAIPWYEICAAENCTYEHAMILGDYYFEQGRASLAASWYEKCYTLSQETDAERVGRLIECYQSLKSKQKEILHWAQILGDMYRRRGDGQSAASAYGLCGEEISDPNTQRFLGDHYFHLGRLSQALDWYDRYVRQTGDCDLWKETADKLWQSDRKAEAIPLYDRFLAKRKNTEIMKLLGDHAFSEGDWSAAIEWYETYGKHGGKSDEAVVENITECYRALSADRAVVAAWLETLGHIRREKNNISGAVEAYSACGSYLRDAELQRMVGDYYFECNDLAKAALWYARLFEQDRDTGLAKTVADRLWQNGMESQAVEWYERFHGGGVQNDETSIRRMIRHYRETGNFASAETWTQILGDWFRGQNDAERAVAAYVECGSGIFDPDRQKFVGDYYFRQNDLVHADIWYDKYFASVGSLKQGADETPAQVALKMGERYYHNGQTELAIKYLMIAGRFDNGGERVDTYGTYGGWIENDNLLLVCDRYVFLKYRERLHLLNAAMIDRYEVIPPRLFNKGRSALYLRDTAPSDVPSAVTVSENLKSDAALNDKFTEWILANQIDLV